MNRQAEVNGVSELVMDRTILISIDIITALALIRLTSKDKLREATIIFLFKQTMTWSFGLLVVEWGLIEYPIREFVKANATSFSFEYFIYPALCVIFNLHYPTGAKWKKWAWFLAFPTAMTILEVEIERNTELIHYVHWNWCYTWVTLLTTYFMSRVYFLWVYRHSGKGYSW
ncbi:CBO0543 family protein [Paenibacillus aurantiacus]|uniref:CBO0543 family protein n=1 Tax=Paenibacillus aurantiacus TaxID=1936118 RepID=A0ABV5KVY8_9BACL